MNYSFEYLSESLNKSLSKMKFEELGEKGLFEPIGYVLQSGGKRLRPALVLMACDLCGGNIDDAKDAAIAVEIFHNFTLLHDDLMDKADVRRNRPTVHRKWSENTAILSGDAMQVLAYQWLAFSKPDLLPDLLCCFSHAALDVCEGQQLDMEFESRDSVGLEDYLVMIRKKTAVLIGASLKMGAICARASSESQKALYDFGISLGIAFQVLDDWLDCYADPEVFGKAVGGDILTGKKTFLLIRALGLADTDTHSQLLELLNDKNLPANEKIASVKAIYDRLNVSTDVHEFVDFLCSEALGYLDKLQTPEKDRENLAELVTKLAKRAK